MADSPWWDHGRRLGEEAGPVPVQIAVEVLRVLAPLASSTNNPADLGADPAHQ